jgi:hypothetical protein
VPASAGELFAKARRIQADRERRARKRKIARELQRLEAIARNEKTLWGRVDELIAGKTTKAYDEAVLIKGSAGRMHFVPQGQHDSSQARSAWNHEENCPSERDD